MEDDAYKTHQEVMDSPSQSDLFFQEEEIKDIPAEEKNDSPEETEEAEEKSSSSDPVQPRKIRTLRHLPLSPQATPGQLLMQARKLAMMELEEVAQITRIRLDYLKALEEDDKTRLPSSRVFVQSYIRTCMDIYQLDRESKEGIFERFFEEEKDLVEDVPEKVLEHIGKEGQVSEEEAQRVRMICIYGAIIAILLLSLTVTTVIAVSLRSSRTERSAAAEQKVRKFDSGKIETLLAPQIPDPVILQQRRKKH